jgi:hypothetical protein
MNRPLYEYRCGTCRSTELVIRPVAPGSTLHPTCFEMWCRNGHQLVGSPVEFRIESTGQLEFRTNRPWRRR